MSRGWALVIVLRWAPRRLRWASKRVITRAARRTDLHSLVELGDGDGVRQQKSNCYSNVLERCFHFPELVQNLRSSELYFWLCFAMLRWYSLSIVLLMLPPREVAMGEVGEVGRGGRCVCEVVEVGEVSETGEVGEMGKVVTRVS